MTEPSRHPQARQEVRWKYRGRWRHGHLGDPPVERDGCLRVFDDYNGAARTLRPEQLQARVRGPRGGLRWTSLGVPQDRAAPGDRGVGDRGIRSAVRSTNSPVKPGGLGL